MLAILVLPSATQSIAGPLPFVGTLSVRATVNGSDVTLSLPGSGTAIVNGSGSGVQLTSLEVGASAFAGMASVVLPATSYPVKGGRLTASNRAGAFESLAGGPSGGGVMPVHGWMKICLFGACPEAVANISVPLGGLTYLGPLDVVGAGNANVVSFGVHLTVIGAPWTTGTVSLSGATGMGFAHGPASQTSSAAQPGGTLQLVTPIRVSTNIGATPAFPTIATLTLQFVPEPGSWILLSGGIVWLAVIGAKRGTR